jgi:DHA3 family macrolide efflux protein-like MFS transporter
VSNLEPATNQSAMHSTRLNLAKFTIVWVGQAISLLGSAMTWFALTIWAYEMTGQATTLALIGLVAIGPAILLSPVAGALVDRWNRKAVMIFSDLTAGVATAIVLVLYLIGSLQIWHLYVVGLVASVFQAFQYPAYSAAVTMMVPKEQYARASGMIEVAGSASGIFAPLLAGVLLGHIGVAGIMTIDLTTLILAVGSLLLVHVPKPPASEAGREGQGSLWRESLYGFRYIIQRPGLLGLQLIFAAGNLVDYGGYILFTPMILARTGGNELVLGSVQSAAAVGGLVGGVLLSVWGGPKRKIHVVLVGWLLAGLCMVWMGLGQVLLVWLPASFFYTFFEPIINGSDLAIWQTKVAPDVQGRVFSTQLWISHITLPIAMVAAGPLADHLFEPAMMPGGSLVQSFGWLVGTGPGAGMALLIICCGLLSTAIPLLGYAFRAVRDVEVILPDHDAVPAEVSL